MNEFTINPASLINRWILLVTCVCPLWSSPHRKASGENGQRGHGAITAFCLHRQAPAIRGPVRLSPVCGQRRQVLEESLPWGPTTVEPSALFCPLSWASVPISPCVRSSYSLQTPQWSVRFFFCFRCQFKIWWRAELRFPLVESETAGESVIKKKKALCEITAFVYGLVGDHFKLPSFNKPLCKSAGRCVWISSIAHWVKQGTNSAKVWVDFPSLDMVQTRRSLTLRAENLLTRKHVTENIQCIKKTSNSLCPVKITAG